MRLFRYTESGLDGSRDEMKAQNVLFTPLITVQFLIDLVILFAMLDLFSLCSEHKWKLQFVVVGFVHQYMRVLLVLPDHVLKKINPESPNTSNDRVSITLCCSRSNWKIH